MKNVSFSYSGSYKDMFALLESQQFSSYNHKSLQDLWYKAHYAIAEEVSGYFASAVIAVFIRPL